MSMEKIRNMFDMVEDMKKLFNKCVDEYNNPDSDEETKRHGFYTATTIQAVMENNNLGQELWSRTNLVL